MSQPAEFEYYTNIKLLGEGSFGKAYLVKCKSDGSLCVIKKMDMKQMSDAEKKETIREAEILKALDHPNIVRFKEVYKTRRNQFCIVMDFCDGGDLSKKILEHKGRNIPENQVLDWFTQICLALKHVHDRKIVHRDLKTQNLFLMKDNTLKVGDFGIAKVLRHTRENCKTMVGTPYYISPEIIESKPYSFRSDIWSLGVILYELCTQKPPFDGIGLPQLALKIVRGQYAPISSYYSKDMTNLIASLLNIEPTKRPHVNEILKKPIINNRIRKFLNETVLQNEFSHTVLHNRNFVGNNLNLDNIPIPQPPSQPQPQISQSQPQQQPLQQQQQNAQAPRFGNHLDGFISPQNNQNKMPINPSRLQNCPSTPSVVSVQQQGYQYQGKNLMNPSPVIPNYNNNNMFFRGDAQKKLPAYNNNNFGQNVQPNTPLDNQKYLFPNPKSDIPPWQKVPQKIQDNDKFEQKKVLNNLNAQDYFPSAIDKLKKEISEPCFVPAGRNEANYNNKQKPLFDAIDHKKQIQIIKDRIAEKKAEEQRKEIPPPVSNRFFEQLKPEEGINNIVSNQINGQYNPNNYKINQPNRKESDKGLNNSKKDLKGSESQEEKEKKRVKAQEERRLMMEDIKSKRNKMYQEKDKDEFFVGLKPYKDSPKQEGSEGQLKDIPIEIYIPKNIPRANAVPGNKSNNSKNDSPGSKDKEEDLIKESPSDDVSYMPRNNQEIISQLLSLDLQSNQESDEMSNNDSSSREYLSLRMGRSFEEDSNKEDEDEEEEEKLYEHEEGDEDENFNEEEEEESKEDSNDSEFNSSGSNQNEEEEIKKNDEDLELYVLEVKQFDIQQDEEQVSESSRNHQPNKEKIQKQQRQLVEIKREEEQYESKETIEDSLRIILEEKIGKQILNKSLKQLSAYLVKEEFDSLFDFSQIFTHLSPQLALECGPLILLQSNLLNLQPLS